MTRLGTALTALTVLALVGCGAEPSPEGPAPTSSATTSSATTSSATTSESSPANYPPKPDEATEKAYLDDLRAIDPVIVDEKNPDRVVVIGRFHCASVRLEPANQAKLIDLTNKRFTSPGHGETLGPDKAEKILAVVRKHICPTY